MNSPQVATFDASASSILSGAGVTLSWSVTGSGPIDVTINPGIGDVTGVTSVTVHPVQTTTYTLTASNSDGSDSSQVTINVVSTPTAPHIASFTATPTSISSGGSSTLSWSVTGTTPITLSIDHSVGTVSNQSNVSVTPSQTTTYTLTASNAAGTATASTTVTVAASSPPPDTQSPTVSITSPTNGASVSTSSITVSGTASDNVGVTSVSYGLNGGSLHGCNGTTSFTCNVSSLNSGSNTITVHAYDAAGNDGTTSVTVSYSQSSDPFNITVNYVSTVDSTAQAAFNAAAARWDSIITQGLPNVNVSIPQGFCGSSGTAAPAMPTAAINGTIDDLRIDVWIGPIDGAGNILGEGGPCYSRSSDHLTVYGYIELDSADVASLEANNMLEATILHEMGHVLGIGTLWNYYRSLLTGAGTSNPRFVGANAVREWHTLGGSNGVPVENCLDSSGNTIPGCGAGTEDSHWREAVFGNELMTGWLSFGSDPLSRMTIGSLQDLGYAVDYAQADPY
ncbi:MAG: Ig-like domain-containing protein [Deinococcales bacterium]